jgi:hypothetical protein
MGGIDSYGIEEGDNSIAYGGFGESASIGPADRSDAVRDVCLLCIPVLWIHQHITHVRLTTIEEGRERKNYEQGSNCQAVVPLRSQHHGITQEKRTLEARRGRRASGSIIRSCLSGVSENRCSTLEDMGAASFRKLRICTLYSTRSTALAVQCLGSAEASS